MLTRHVRVWAKEDPFGIEFADVTIDAGRLRASGVTVVAAPLPYRLDYELTTGVDYVTTRLVVRVEGDGWRRHLDLRRVPTGAWWCAADAQGECDLPEPGGASPPQLAGALDCDLGLSPLTNTMPVLRHGLLDGGGSGDLLMAWVSVPDLTVRPTRQRYTYVRHKSEAAVVRYEDDDFAADLVLDPDGLVRRYPGVAFRVG